MKVNLVTYTEMPEEIVYFAARTCYSDKNFEELWGDAITDGFSLGHAPLIKRLKHLGHTSPFEHASFTFSVEDVSRVTTHQLVRHRVASYSQRSQRYAGQSRNVVCPESISSDPDMDMIFNEAADVAYDAYDMLIKAGVPKEDARYILPHGATSSIVVTMNARELIHFHELRTGKGAQWEIKELAEEMMRLAKEVASVLFDDSYKFEHSHSIRDFTGQEE